MLVNTGRSPTRVDVCDFNALLLREYAVNLNTKNYVLSQSPLPMSYRDLRSFMTNSIPSNIVILPKSLSLSQASLNKALKQERKNEHRKKKHKRTAGYDVYRSLIQSDSCCSIISEKNALNDDSSLLGSSFTIDHISPSTNGFFRPQYLPKIQKRHLTSKTNTQLSGTNLLKTYASCSSLYTEHMPPTQPEIFHRTTPASEYCGEQDDDMTATTTTISSTVSENRARKQLHVYIP